MWQAITASLSRDACLECLLQTCSENIGLDIPVKRKKQRGYKILQNDQESMHPWYHLERRPESNNLDWLRQRQDALEIYHDP